MEHEGSRDIQVAILREDEALSKDFVDTYDGAEDVAKTLHLPPLSSPA